jgi:hypothetical protein
MKFGIATTGVLCAALALGAVAQSAPAPELQKLDVSVGRWEFHGSAKNARTGKVTQWTWKEDCRWSPNRLFLECTFDNIWAGRPARSLVVDTYNSTDHSYWHWEMFADGQTGAHPFAAKMDITGNTWIEYGAAPSAKRPGERIVYDWSPPDKVRVRIETSRDGTHWTTVDDGVGTKLP